MSLKEKPGWCDMGFGDILRQASSPSTSPVGIGGTVNTIWHTDVASDLVYELSTADFSVIRLEVAPSGDGRGIGGDNSTIWYGYHQGCVSELSTTDFSLIRVGTPLGYGNDVNDIGGDASVIWCYSASTGYVYELSTADFSIIKQGLSPYQGASAGYGGGTGGDINHIWHAVYVGSLYQLSTTDFSVVRQSSQTFTWPTGAGGDDNAIWLCCAHGQKLYELDSSSFPTQYSGPRAQIAGTMQGLCLVAAGDGNPDITGKLRIAKGGTIYDIYLVETTDPEAGAIRIQTPSGVKAIRKLT